MRDDAGFWELYASSFPAAEREPMEVILRSLEQGPGAARLVEQGRVTRGIAWEIDDPASDVHPDERCVRQGRLQFFEKLGGRILDTAYTQPPVDGRTFVPMRLMFRPAAGEDPPPDAQVEKLVRAIYFEKYHAINNIASSTLERLIARAPAV